jgi:hypothetical protein
LCFTPRSPGLLALPPRQFHRDPGERVRDRPDHCVEPGFRLAFTWRQSTFKPDQITHVEIRFEAVAKQTRVTVEHHGRDSVGQEHLARDRFSDRLFLQRHGEWWQDLLRSYTAEWAQEPRDYALNHRSMLGGLAAGVAGNIAPTAPLMAKGGRQRPRPYRNSHKARAGARGLPACKLKFGAKVQKICANLSFECGLRAATKQHPQTDNCIAYQRSPFNPTSTTPIPTALVFAPNKVLTRSPTPIIWMNDNASFSGIFILSLHMPTHVAPTRNCCRNARSRKR